MNLQFLLDGYVQSPPVQQLAEAILLPKGQKILCTKMAGSYAAVLFFSTVSTQ